MKKIALLLVLSSTFMSAQIKTVLSPYGEKVNINLSPPGDNLGNHTATTTLNLNNNDISNIADINIKKEAQFLDQNGISTNYFSLKKDNGTFGIYNSLLGSNALSIDETTSKTTMVEAQIPKGTDASLPQKDDIAVSTDANGNVIWKPLMRIKGATMFQFFIRADQNSKFNSAAFNPVSRMENIPYTAPVTGVLYLEANLISTVPDIFLTKSPTVVKTEMAVMVDGTPIGYGSSLITTAPVSTFANKTDLFPATTTIYCQIPVTEGTTYSISVQARTPDQTNGGSYVGLYISKDSDGNPTTAFSTLLGTLVTD
ncbi:hypothetical protein [Flavobacterium johnsoniae]|uniref:hypothetical protein n=1 Tax=unclassified Flavobacterium TaxID=196869 RepID=UPI000EB3D301